MAKRPRNKNYAEDRIAHAVDQLAEFEDFRDTVLPALRKDLSAGLSAEELYKKYQSLAAARGISIALTDQDSGKALSALKDILDRTQGKAVERKDVRHRLEGAKDEEIDAALLSKLQDLEDEEESTRH